MTNLEKAQHLVRWWHSQRAVTQAEQHDKILCAAIASHLDASSQAIAGLIWRRDDLGYPRQHAR